jgi:hypothetical protein
MAITRNSLFSCKNRCIPYRSPHESVIMRASWRKNSVQGRVGCGGRFVIVGVTTPAKQRDSIALCSLFLSLSLYIYIYTYIAYAVTVFPLFFQRATRDVISTRFTPLRIILARCKLCRL